MSLDTTKTVRELAIEMPGATRIFETLKIDYCCGGHVPFAEACEKAGVEVETIACLLEQAHESPLPIDMSKSFQDMSLAELSGYIVHKHHTFARDEAERITALLEKVYSAHGANHPELLNIKSAFQILREDLLQHMLKEERVLFPYITRLESAVDTYQPVPQPPFGTVRNPIAMMMREHDAAGDLLRQMREWSLNYAVPPDACISYRTLYGALEAYEADLHQHIHLENNILFPSALEIENRALQSATA
jgi:regulator of cell morphogenesis and NO signaling